MHDDTVASRLDSYRKLVLDARQEMRSTGRRVKRAGHGLFRDGRKPVLLPNALSIPLHQPPRDPLLTTNPVYLVLRLRFSKPFAEPNPRMTQPDLRLVASWHPFQAVLHLGTQGSVLVRSSL